MENWIALVLPKTTNDKKFTRLHYIKTIKNFLLLKIIYRKLNFKYKFQYK